MKIINTIFILLLSLNLVLSVEDTCFTNLKAKVDNFDLRNYNTTAEACLNYIYYLTCDTEGYITSFPLSDNNVVKNQISWSDLSCFSRLTTIYISNANLDPNFLYTIDRPLYRLKFGSSNIKTINQTIPVTIDNLTFDELTGTIKASYVKNIRAFDSGFNKPLDVEVDGLQTNSQIRTFTFATRNVPDFTQFEVPYGMYCNLKFFMPINESTLSNLDSFLRRCSSIMLSATSDFYFNFPQSFTTVFQPLYNSLSFGNYMFVRTNQSIDFSNYINERGTYSYSLTFAYSGNMFNGAFPFTSFPKNFNDFYVDFYYNQFDLVPDLKVFKVGARKNTVGIRRSGMGGALPPNDNIFTGTDRFTIYENKINGTLDKSWCNGVELDVSDNKMTGDLPLCYYCYLDLENVKKRFKLNNFTNFLNTDRSQCNYETIIPNVRLITNFTIEPKPSFTSFEIFGENLGYETTNIQFTPVSQSISYVNFGNRISTSIYNPPTTGLVKKVNMTIKSLNLTYTLSISITPPIINQMIQNNDTLTFIGEYFTYNKSDTTIIIDNYQVCNIIRTTFYQIECVLDKQIRDRGLRPTTITVKGLTTVANFNYEYIVYPCYCKGICNSINGTCCVDGYTISEGYFPCTVPNHYVSTLLPVPSNTGGDLVVLGWFGSLHDQLTIMVGENICNITSVNNKVIICSIDSGLGIQSVKVSQNNLENTNLFNPYYELPPSQVPTTNINRDVFISLNFPFASSFPSTPSQ